MVHHQFDQIVVVQVWVVSKVLQDILHSDVTVVVSVQVQERLPHMVVAIGELLLQFGLQLQKTVLHHSALLVGALVLSIPHLFGLEVLLVICRVLHQIQMREECFLESIQIDAWLQFIEDVVFRDIGLNLLAGIWDSVFYNYAVHELGF